MASARKTVVVLEAVQKILDENKQIIDQAKSNEAAGQTEKNEKLLKVRTIRTFFVCPRLKRSSPENLGKYPICFRKRARTCSI